MATESIADKIYGFVEPEAKARRDLDKEIDNFLTMWGIKPNRSGMVHFNRVEAERRHINGSLIRTLKITDQGGFHTYTSSGLVVKHTFKGFDGEAEKQEVLNASGIKEAQDYLASVNERRFK